MNRLVAALLITAAAGCGNANVVAPEPLTVLDTHPGSGSLVPAGDSAVVILFSSAVDEASLANAVTLEKTSAAGMPVSDVNLRYDTYDAETFAATYRTAPLDPGAYFAITVKMSAVHAASGAMLRNDFKRSFRTLPE